MSRKLFDGELTKLSAEMACVMLYILFLPTTGVADVLIQSQGNI